MVLYCRESVLSSTGASWLVDGGSNETLLLWRVDLVSPSSWLLLKPGVVSAVVGSGRDDGDSVIGAVGAALGAVGGDAVPGLLRS